MPKNGPIIIVEDDSDDQELLRESFEELGIPNMLRFFNSCLSALDFLLATVEKPFLIISDINLPIMSGIEFFKKVAADASLKRKCIPFIFLSTTSANETVEQIYQLPAQGFFVKPVSVQEHQELIKAIIDYWRFARIPA